MRLSLIYLKKKNGDKIVLVGFGSYKLDVNLGGQRCHSATLISKY